ncbi:septum formation family protein [Nocardioides sp. AE5]|uniref:septum formation family protein n=1 Tax=Nocardioides sp. AE5 TaxID=2962573 RepID=UPI0028816E01|nr:septum formation family protein [Nocardioides sp. AE5]MDT0201571.1 septum formation family protein [Nocardioides sp. AE5]
MTVTRAGIGLLGALALALPLTACDTNESRRDDNGAIVEENEKASVFEMRVGDCYDDPEEGMDDEFVEVETAKAVPCGQPHDNEVFHIVDLPDGDFPGDAETNELGMDLCYEQFEAFVGLPYEESALDFFIYQPTAESWRAGDREIACPVYGEEKLTGTQKGSGI